MRYATVILLSLSCAVALANDIGAVAQPDYRIGIDDVLDVAVWNVAELQKTIPVRPDGKISLPLVNDVVAAGLTPMELRDVLTKKIAVYVQSPDVSVVVREIRSQKISILGQVKTPGRYDLKGPATVLDALALAGGFTEFASRRKITVLRQDGSVVERVYFDFDAAISAAGNRANFPLKAGDIIVIP